MGRRFFAALLSLIIPAAAQADVIVTGFAEGSIRHYLDNGTQVAPITAGTVFGAAGMTVGPGGDLFVSAQSSIFGPPGAVPDFIYRVNPLSGAVTPFITLASGYVPGGLRFGPDGSLYVARNGGQMAAAGSGAVDRYNGTTGALIGPVVSNLHQPTNLLFRGNELFISNFGAGNVIRFDGTTSAPFSSGGGLAGPTGLIFGPGGLLYVTDTLAGAVRRYDGTTGSFVDDFVAAGPASPLNNQFPSDLMFDQPGRMLVANLGFSFNPADPPNLHGNVMQFNSTTGAFQSVFASDILGASALLSSPVPEPGTLVLVGGAALIGFGRRHWKQRIKGDREAL